MARPEVTGGFASHTASGPGSEQAVPLPALLTLRWRGHGTYRLAAHGLLVQDRLTAGAPWMAAFAGLGAMADVVSARWLRANPTRSAFWPRLCADLAETAIWSPVVAGRPALVALPYTLAAPNTVEAAYRAVLPTKRTTNRTVVKVLRGPIVQLAAVIALRRSQKRRLTAEDAIVFVGPLAGAALGSYERRMRQARVAGVRADAGLAAVDIEARAELELLLDSRTQPLMDLRAFLDQLSRDDEHLRRALDELETATQITPQREGWMRLSQVAGFATYAPPDAWALALAPEQATTLIGWLDGRRVGSLQVLGQADALARHPLGGRLSLVIDGEQIDLDGTVFEPDRPRTRLGVPLGRLADVVPAGFALTALWRLIAIGSEFGGVPVADACAYAAVDIVLGGYDIILHGAGLDNVSPGTRRRTLLVCSWLEGLVYLVGAQARSRSLHRHGGPVALAGGSGMWSFALIASYYAADMTKIEKTLSLIGGLTLGAVSAVLANHQRPRDLTWLAGQLPWLGAIVGIFLGLHRAIDNEINAISDYLGRGIAASAADAARAARSETIQFYRRLAAMLADMVGDDPAGRRPLAQDLRAAAERISGDHELRTTAERISRDVERCLTELS